MSNKLYKELEVLENGKKKCLKIDVSYSKGGMNYFSGKPERRGIYVHFTEVERSTESGYATESHMLFSGSSFKILAVELKRLSQKRLEEVFQAVYQIKEDLFEQQKALNKEILFQMISGLKV